METKSKIEISLVIPIFNEGKNLYSNICKIKQYTAPASASYEIIIVDDGSADNSWEVITQLSNEFSCIKGIRFTRNFGKESAIFSGLEESSGDAVIIIDSDLQHPPELIPQMVKTWREKGVEVVNTKKFRRQKETFFRLFAVKTFYKIMKYLSGMDLTGATDYKLLDRKVVDKYLKLPEINRFFRALIPWIGFNQYTIEFEVPQADSRESRWSLTGLIKLSLNALIAFSSIPLRLVTIFGIITFFISFILILETLYLKITGQALEGFATVIISVLFTGSIIMISLGIIGEYLARIYDEIKNRPKYIAKERLNKISDESHLKSFQDNG